MSAWSRDPGPYGGRILEHFRRPRNRGLLPAPDIAREEVNEVCGDRVRMEARVADGRISEARWTGDACAICVAAASILTGAVEGLSLADAAAYDEGRLLDSLEADIPTRRLECALLPLRALRGGILETGGREAGG